MKNGVMVIFVVSVLFISCKKTTEKDDTIWRSSLYGKTYILKVDKISKIPDVQLPSDNLQENDYTLANEEIQYEIVFTEDGDSITINPGNIIGERTSDGENSLFYQLDDGLFAGGRFIIWIDNDDLVAEYTIYGSGLPIIKSERGILELK